MSNPPFDAAQFNRFLHEQIPLTAAMQLQIEQLDTRRVRIRAPLSPNRNHHGTAFGGALATLGIVTGWAAIHHGLGAAGLTASLVVRHSTLDYLQPVTGDLVADSTLPVEAWARFADAVRAGRKARLEVTSIVRCALRGVDAVRVQASYVALPAASD